MKISSSIFGIFIFSTEMKKYMKRKKMKKKKKRRKVEGKKSESNAYKSRIYRGYLGKKKDYVNVMQNLQTVN